MTAAITVSERAARRIGQILSKEGDGAKLRISVEGGGCSGFQYKFDVEHAQAEDDLVIERDNAVVLVDPAADLGGIHGIKHLGGFRIGHRAAIGTEVPGGVKSEIGFRRHADFVMGNGPQNDGAGGSAQAVDNHRLARTTKVLVFVDVGSDSAAAILGDPDHCVTSSHPRKQ